jgi:Cellulose biosynthesis protein BcsS
MFVFGMPAKHVLSFVWRSLCIATTSLVTPAWAADWYTGRKAQEADYSKSIVIDVSGSVTTKSSEFADITGTIAVDKDLTVSGTRVRVEGLVGTYGYTNSNSEFVTGRQESGAVTMGYEWISRNLSYSLYLGLIGQDNTLSIPDPKNPVVGGGLGIKTSAEVYYKPNARTMLSAYTSFSTVHGAYYMRLKGGWLVSDGIYAGPELSFLGDDFSGQWRMGAHLTGVKLGSMQLGLSGGIMSDRVLGTGGYAILDGRLGF